MWRTINVLTLDLELAHSRIMLIKRSCDVRHDLLVGAVKVHLPFSLVAIDINA